MKKIGLFRLSAALFLIGSLVACAKRGSSSHESQSPDSKLRPVLLYCLSVTHPGDGTTRLKDLTVYETGPEVRHSTPASSSQAGAGDTVYDGVHFLVDETVAKDGALVSAATLADWPVRLTVRNAGATGKSYFIELDRQSAGPNDADSVELVQGADKAFSVPTANQKMGVEATDIWSCD